MGPAFGKSCVGNHRSKNTTMISCPDIGTLWHSTPSSSSYVLPTSSLVCPEPGRGRWKRPLWAEHSAVMSLCSNHSLLYKASSQVKRTLPQKMCFKPEVLGTFLEPGSPQPPSTGAILPTQSCFKRGSIVTEHTTHGLS